MDDNKILSIVFGGMGCLVIIYILAIIVALGIGVLFAVKYLL